MAEDDGEKDEEGERGGVKERGLGERERNEVEDREREGDR